MRTGPADDERPRFIRARRWEEAADALTFHASSRLVCVRTR